MRTLNEKKVNGKRLLLEVVARTSQLIHSSSKQSLVEYQNLANKLQVNHPAFYVLGGLMELLLGAMLYLPSLGYSQRLINHGFTTVNTGFFAHHRAKLSHEILEFASIQVKKH